VHTLVRINTILEGAGLLHLDADQQGTQIDVNASQAVALASGASAHIYINLQGRDPPGIVAPEDYDQVQQQIIQALAEIEDEDGQLVFTRILTRQELVGIHLNSPNSGDVFVQAAPGYCLVDTVGLDEVLAPSPFRAEGGFDATLPDMHGIFIAAGDNLAQGKTISAAHIIDVAPTIARLLHFEPAPTVSGHAIEDIWR
jgi:predicted AlkP superfamily phosphohydrolase/phosphomutase